MKEINNQVMIPVLKKMCEIAGHDYDKITWTNWSHKKLTYTHMERLIFYNWLVDYIYGLNIKELGALVGFPKIYHKRKKKAIELANELVHRLGFSVEKNNKKSLKKRRKK